MIKVNILKLTEHKLNNYNTKVSRVTYPTILSLSFLTALQCPALKGSAATCTAALGLPSLNSEQNFFDNFCWLAF